MKGVVDDCPTHSIHPNLLMTCVTVTTALFWVVLVSAFFDMHPLVSFVTVAAHFLLFFIVVSLIAPSLTIRTLTLFVISCLSVTSGVVHLLFMSDQLARASLCSTYLAFLSSLELR